LVAHGGSPTTVVLQTLKLRLAWGRVGAAAHFIATYLSLQ
jgi:hypothetical protein